MFNVLIFSDLHAHAHKNSPRRLDDCMDCLGWVIDVARQHGIKKLLFLGDLFQDRQRIHVLAYNRVYNMLASAQDLEFTLLIGNHDMWFYDKRDVSSIIPLGALPNVRVVGDPVTIDFDGLPIDFSPYSPDPARVLSGFKKKSPVLCGHLAVDGALLNYVHNTYSEVEIESDSEMIPLSTSFFKGWQKVFLGHYHGSQILDGFIEYVGSPLELSWNECNQQKHVILFDTKTMEQMYVINTFSPKHLLLKAEDLGSRIHDLSNSFLKVQVAGDDVLELKHKIMQAYDVRELDFSDITKLDQTVFVEDAQEQFDLAEGDILERFVRANGCDDLDPELLLEIGRGIATSELT